MKISKQRVKPQKANQREVSHHFVKRMATKISGNRVGVTSGRVDFQLLIDVALVHHRVENVQDLKDVPGSEIVLENLNLFIRLLLQLGAKLLE